MALAPAGQKALRVRVQAKKLRTKEQLLGQRKHKAAMQDIARRRVDQRQMEHQRQMERVRLLR